jgi:urease beta subunit
MTYRATRRGHAELGSHFDFFEANRARRISRSAALGRRQAVRREAGLLRPIEVQSVSLTPCAAARDHHAQTGFVEKKA